MAIRYNVLILFLIVCIAVFSTVHGQDGPVYYEVAGDIGETSSGQYGESSVTYSSDSYTNGMSGGYSSYQGVPNQQSPYSFKTNLQGSQKQVAQAQLVTTQPSTINAAAQTFQAPQSSDQQSLLAYNILSNQPSYVFYSQAMQPWQTFVSIFPKNMPMLWVNTQAGWQWYATCPLGGWAQDIMFIPRTGTLGVYEVYPDRNTKYHDYGYATPGYHYIWFNGDTPGRHTLIVTVDKIPSNAVAFDVI